MKGLPKNILERFPAITVNEFDDNQRMNDFLNENKLPVCQPIKSSEGMKGILVLGQRLTNKEYAFSYS